MYSIRLKKSAAKELQRLPGFAIHKISRALDGLEKDPRPAGAKKLEGISGPCGESVWATTASSIKLTMASKSSKSRELATAKMFTGEDFAGD